MSIRLQVVMEEAELDAIRAAASEQGITVSQWVRETLRAARRRVSGGDAERKLASIRAADRHAYPTADIDQMVAEIERGYGEATE
ncbi:MAG: antitoxin [Candidatus Sulfomarinibacteraceae bacterium]